MAPASARASQHLLSSPAEARPNVSTLAAQQLPRPTSPSDTPNAAVAEGTQPEIIPNGPGSTGSTENAPVSIIEAATKIARDQTAAHDAKLAVFRAFSESFEQTAKQFTSGSHNSIAKQVATKFLNLWTQSLADLEEPPKPTYSSVLASGKTTQGQLAITASAPPQRKQQTTTRLQGRPPVAPPKEDLRVFVRLDADAPARNHERYAIRAHIAARVGIDLRRIPAAFPVNTGWAILASDVATRELLVQRQADWAVDLDATAVEISQKWHSQECTALEQCANCLGPHCADDPKCPARPKRVHGMVRRLTKEEKSLVRQMGVQLSAQQKRQTPKARVSDQSNQSPGRPQILSLESTAPRAAGGDGSSDMGAIYEPAAPSTPCIVVATTPPHSCDATLMPRCFPRNRSDRRILRIFQANVGKIPPAHDCALALADSEQYDIILLQEPWTGLKDGRCLTKTHQAYDTFSPVNDWDGRDTRPRVMTYVRRSAGLVADQKRPAATRDILWLTVNGITVVNFYRQPYHDGALEILLQWTVPDKCLVAGDFNAKHPSWQAGRREDRGEEIAFWAMDNRLGLLNPVDVPTNAHGNTVDLAFCNIPLADAVVEDHLATGSDHFTLSITLPGQVLAPLPIGKIHLNSDEELKRFIELVEAGAAFIPITTASPSELDSFASALVNLLGCAARAAGRPAPSQEELHSVVRRAKRLYWRNLIDSFTDSASVFRAVRWLKSPGPFQAPPLQIDDRVYETQLEKATALRQATLERRTANDDIPDPWISVNTDRTIPFTDRVSPEETRDATLRTGNTSLVPTILRCGCSALSGMRSEVSSTSYIKAASGLATIRSPSEKQKWS
ncbi:endonuclease-reverse transcriptase domain-containing protein [Hirsutella rhossiliensis]|uniref:Endonuclease-reverse transcriptase domain-containing protein n=1 Tax=Hirsutella rhossiliensis TaxID=111463 RepID=A0A9P8MJZ2_9HYPO|nr:endonuclease-reverse transcriptase domain-containing protein [Hirsutella rhossiliensis]KAH0957733.1 endonuclease-reverse transcriptase domain-containing protein [Hirsutella rhossiliensis]